MLHCVSMTDAHVVESASSIDAACRWDLRHRANDRFDYVAHRYVDLRADGQIEGYRGSSYTSGLFDTAQTARADALEAISWLPGQL